MSDSAKQYLDLIAEHLQEHHAAVLVGSGFSRNADKLDPDGPNSPLWMDLARAFQDRLGYSDQQRVENMDPLRLADYVELAYGRPELDQLLQKCIHDDGFCPSKLHMDLMRLPWTDIFTTNYDTLLERAAEEIVEKKFKTILHKEDLVGSAGVTRIIKLHGSFPSARPFIISSEDYRTYPQKFAPFLNTVQQSLLENTLCLIGFSGTDPNFQQWIGWIRDNLGKKNAPFMYLLQHKPSSEAEKRWMRERNIVPVDLSELCELCKDESPRNIYQHALGYLTKKLHEGNRFEVNFTLVKRKWNFNVNFPNLKESPELADEALKKLQQLHASYPGWLIPPQQELSKLRFLVKFQLNQGLNYFAQNKAVGTSEIFRAVEYLYEYDWLHDVALLPLLSAECKQYHKILQYIADNEKESFTNEQKEKLKKYWISIQISILCSLRQDSAWDDWTALYNILMEKTDWIRGIQNHRIRWEECLCARDQYDFEQLKKRLRKWEIPSSSPKWVLRRGGLLAECGLFYEADKSIKDALHWIRLLPQERQLHPEVSSVESSLMALGDYVEQAIRIGVKYSDEYFDETKRSNSTNQEKQRLGISGISSYQGEPEEENDDDYSKNKDDVSRKMRHNHCGVSWEEQNEWFVRRLPEMWQPYSESRAERTFDFGGKRSSCFWGSDKEASMAFMFLDFREKTGMPFYLNSIDCDKKTACYAAERIARYQPIRSVLIAVRADESDKIATILTRGKLNAWTRQEADKQSSSFRKAIEQTMPRLTDKDRFFQRSFDYLVADVLPEILSELCSKCSMEELKQLINLVEKIYAAPNRMCYQKTKSLLKRLLACWPRERYSELVSILLRFPVIEEGNDVRQSICFPDPILLVDFNKMDHMILNELRSTIDQIFSEYTQETGKRKDMLLSRMLACLELGQLSEDQRQFLGKELWEGEKMNLPSGWGYTICLSLPAPESTDPIRWVCCQVMQEIQKYAKKNGYGSGDNIVLDRLLYLVSKYPEQFFDSEVSQMISELSDRVAFLSKNIIDGFSDFLGPDEGEHQVCSVLHALWRLTAGRKEWKPTPEDTTAMRKILEEARRCGAYHYGLFSRWESLLGEPRDTAVNLADSMRSNKEQAWWEYHMLAQACLEPEKNLLTDEEVTLGLDVVVQHISWRVSTLLPAVLQMAKIVVENCPERISMEQRRLLSEGLSYLASETEILVEDDIETASCKGEKRIAAVALAKSLLNQKQEGIDPKVLEQWQQIWENPNEFAEIRNA